jgi:hypothetical protein
MKFTRSCGKDCDAIHGAVAEERKEENSPIFLRGKDRKSQFSLKKLFGGSAVGWQAE